LWSNKLDATKVIADLNRRNSCVVREVHGRDGVAAEGDAGSGAGEKESVARAFQLPIGICTHIAIIGE
jgi:hypothetical protein